MRVISMLGLRHVPPWVGDLLVALWCLAVWIDPEFGGEHSKGTLLWLILAEFIFLFFVAVMFAVRVGKKDPRWLLLFAAPALWVGWGIASAGPILAFGIHVVTEVLGAVNSGDVQSGPEKPISPDLPLKWGMGIMLWLVSPIIVIAAPMPALGWTSATIPSDLAWTVDGGGLSYHMTAATITVYFFGRTLLEFLWRTQLWRRFIGVMSTTPE